MKPKPEAVYPQKERRVRRWCVTDLVCDPYSGKLKETLLWSNAGKASALFWFSWKCYNDTDTADLWLIVMVVLTAHAMFSQFIMTKFGVAGGTTTTTTTASADVTTVTSPSEKRGSRKG